MGGVRALFGVTSRVGIGRCAAGNSVNQNTFVFVYSVMVGSPRKRMDSPVAGADSGASTSSKGMGAPLCKRAKLARSNASFVLPRDSLICWMGTTKSPCSVMGMRMAGEVRGSWWLFSLFNARAEFGVAGLRPANCSLEVFDQERRIGVCDVELNVGSKGWSGDGN